MKKFTISFLIFLCLSFNIIGLIPSFAIGNIYKQGIYKPSDFNFSGNSGYAISNTSSNQLMYLIILDEDLFVIEAIRLQPNSGKFDLIPMAPDYKILIIGKGDLYFSPKKSWIVTLFKTLTWRRYVMKKFTILFLIFLCFLFNIIGLTPAAAVSDTFKEGIYSSADLKVSPDNVYSITNISKNNNMHVFIFNQNELTVQNEQLLPGSSKQDTIPILPGYTIAVLGKGEVTIVPKTP